MRAASLTPLLLRARDAGLTLAADRGDLVITPRSALTPEIRAELLANKAELLDLLTWSEPVADALLKDAAAYLAEFFFEARTPDCHLAGLDAYEVAIDEAFYEQDMFALRIAVRAWVQAGVGMFRANSKQDRDRGAA
jgi:hypothetical protein